MNIRVQTSSIKNGGSSILLMVMPSDELLAEQARVVATVPGQVPVGELHITLMRSAPFNKDLPSPPAFVDLCKEARLVSREHKTSVYLPVTQESQQELERYAQALEQALNTTGLYNQDRLFHVSLTNLVGLPNESVANVWEVASQSV